MRFISSINGVETEHGTALEAWTAANDENREAIQYGEFPNASAYILQDGYRIELGDLK